MTYDATVAKGPRKDRFQRRRKAAAPETVMIHMGGRTIQAEKQTVPSGIGSISRFFFRLLG